MIYPQNRFKKFQKFFIYPSPLSSPSCSSLLYPKLRSTRSMPRPRPSAHGVGRRRDGAVNSQGFSSFVLPFRPAVTSARRFSVLSYAPAAPVGGFALLSPFFPLRSSCAAFCRVFSLCPVNFPFFFMPSLSRTFARFELFSLPVSFSYTFSHFPEICKFSFSALFAFIRPSPTFFSVFCSGLPFLLSTPFCFLLSKKALYKHKAAE